MPSLSAMRVSCVCTTLPTKPSAVSETTAAKVLTRMYSSVAPPRRLCKTTEKCRMGALLNATYAAGAQEANDLARRARTSRSAQERLEIVQVFRRELAREGRHDAPAAEHRRAEVDVRNRPA